MTIVVPIVSVIKMIVILNYLAMNWAKRRMTKLEQIENERRRRTEKEKTSAE